jgi:hypothetical protein
VNAKVGVEYKWVKLQKWEDKKMRKRLVLRNKLMKKITALTFAIMLVAALAGCGNAAAESPADTPQGNERTSTPTPPPSTPGEDDDFLAFIAPEPELSPFDLLEVAPESDFSYKFDSATGGMIITKYNGSMTGLRIPDTIEGEPVTAIGNGEEVVFEGREIESVYIPDSVAAINGAIFNSRNEIAVSYKGFTYKNNEVVTAAVLSGYGYEPMEYGGHNWFVLDRAEGKALLLSAGIIEERSYHADGGEITWEGSTIRQWLNEDFYYSIGKEERERIAETSIVNNDNPWYGTEGGNDTVDKIFLLSLEEVVQYFGDSGQLANRPVNDGGWELNYIDDEYNAARIAYLPAEIYLYRYGGNYGSASWWWLRSPGYNSYNAAIVSYDGHFHVDGYIGSYVGNDYGGVRPALWLNL